MAATIMNKGVNQDGGFVALRNRQFEHCDAYSPPAAMHCGCGGGISIFEFCGSGVPGFRGFNF
jgi:hypothetical protein